MRIKVRLPKVEPDQYTWPTECPQEDCHGHHFKPHGVKGERKAIRDLRLGEVVAYRRKCLSCGQSFRVYPRGVCHNQQSDRLKAMSVLLYALGLSYGAVEDFLEAFGIFVAKTTVYENVQEAGLASRQRQQGDLAQGEQTTRHSRAERRPLPGHLVAATRPPTRPETRHTYRRRCESPPPSMATAPRSQVRAARGAIASLEPESS